MGPFWTLVIGLVVIWFVRNGVAGGIAEIIANPRYIPPATQTQTNPWSKT